MPRLQQKASDLDDLKKKSTYTTYFNYGPMKYRLAPDLKLESFNMFTKEPIVREMELSKKFSFMYENFLIATQSAVYLLLEKVGESVHVLRFDCPTCKYGGLNDEARGGHPLANHGLGVYGIYEVENSPWISEMKAANRVHPRHSDSLFEGRKHYVACFKDVMFECICQEMSEVTLSLADVQALVQQEISSLES